MHAPVRLLLFALICTVLASGCKTTSGSRSASDNATAPIRVDAVEVNISDASGAPMASLNGDFYVPASTPVGATVVMVPGAGRVSRKGERDGNGSRQYDDRLLFTERFAHSLVEQGFHVLAYDKRTCTTGDNPICRTNPRADIDAQGPVAMAKDVDAACAVASRNGNTIVLFAHGQAAQIALRSTCAQTAAAIVLISPMPDAVDAVIVRGLTRRATLLRQWGEKEAKSDSPKTKAAGEEKIKESLALKNKAADLADTFKLLRAQKFAADARVLGATPAFWEGWMALTKSTPELAAATPSPVVVVLGQWDSQYAPQDKRKIEKLASSPGNFIVVTKGDHYLMIDRQFDPASHKATIERVLDILRAGPSAPAS